MEIVPLKPAGSQVIDGYGEGMFRIGGVQHQGSVLVLPQQTLAWNPGSVGDLTIADFQPVLTASPTCDVLLLGCGERMLMPHERLRTSLREHGISIDPMDTGAACRTFNILLSEGRRAAAALIAL